MVIEIYDGKTPVKWSGAEELTPEQMEGDYRYPQMSEPAVLYKNADGEATDWVKLNVLTATYNVETKSSPEETLNAVIEKMNEKPETTEQAIARVETKADTAIQIAEQAGTNPQLQVVARLLAPSIDFAPVTSTDVVAIPDYIPKWAEGMKLAQNDPVKHKGKIYRASQAIPNTQAIYPPDTAGESLYYPIDVADDGIIIYRACHGAYDQVKAGELRHYPGATDPVYRAKVDTAYDPVTVPANWELVE